MGIKDLTKLIKENAPEAIKLVSKKSFKGKVIAIDSSVLIYQFLAQVRIGGQTLQNENGEDTSHIQGLLNRATNLIIMGIKPIFVFDGKPPEFKYGTLEKRTAAKEKAKEKLEEAKEKMEEDDTEETRAEVDKFAKQTIKMTGKHISDCKTLLRLMGIPVIDAPCEAEATCAELVKKGIAYAVGSEDMDTLTFGSGILLRKFTMPESYKEPVMEINLSIVLSKFDLDQDQFIDLCILMGCDYCPNITGVGPKTAFKLIKKHHCLENILEEIDRKKYHVPEILDEKLEEIRELFVSPNVIDTKNIDTKFRPIDKEGLIEFLCIVNNFKHERVMKIIEKLNISKKVNTNQSSITSFFKKIVKD